MTLSEMLRNAEGKYEQRKWDLFGNPLTTGSKTRCCALGALVLESSGSMDGVVLNSEAADVIRKHTGVDTYAFHYLPTGRHEPLYACIYMLNDEFGWSFTKIADWLEERGL